MEIHVEDVSKSFGDFHALARVSMTAPEGALTALLGPSGSGKSTLLRVIAGLETPDRGRVVIGGRDATGVAVRDRRVGFVFQHYAAFRHMSVRDNVGFALTVRRRPRAEVRARVDELLELVRLTSYAERRPAELSGGQRQRMALARALAARPEVLLLDEPFGALDANVRAELREWLRRLHDEVAVTTIVVTHDQEEAMEVAEHIVVLNDGRLEQAGPPEELYERPASEFVLRFVGPVAELGDALVRPHDIEVLHAPEEGTIEALVERVVRLGFEVRAHVLLADGGRLPVAMTRARAAELELEPGQIVFLRPDRSGAFSRATSLITA